LSEKKGSEIIKVITACVITIGLFSAAFLVSTQLSMAMAMATSRSEVSVQTNGAAIAFDQPSIVLDETSMIPLSTVREVFDASVEFDNSAQTVTFVVDDVIVIMQVGSNVYTRNGERITLDAPPQVLGGRLMVPARPLVESFGTQAGR